MNRSSPILYVGIYCLYRTGSENERGKLHRKGDTMWKPQNWQDPDDDLGKYVFGIPEESSGQATRTAHGQNARTERRSSEAKRSDTHGPEHGSRRRKEANDGSSASGEGRNDSGGPKHKPHPPFKFGPETKRVTCKICDRSFFDKSTLNRHIAAVHATNRPHVCPDCNKAFSIKSLLQQHIKVSINYHFKCDTSQPHLTRLHELMSFRRSIRNQKSTNATFVINPFPPARINSITRRLRMEGAEISCAITAGCTSALQQTYKGTREVYTKSRNGDSSLPCTRLFMGE